jgi:vitamin K-dependent gamma-carboxylase
MTELAARGWARFESTLARSVDGSWLRAFRVLFGLTMSVSMLRFIAYGWIDAFFVTPRFHFKYWGFAWVEPLSPALMHGLFWGLFALGLCIAAGLFFRLAALCFALGFAYLQLIDVATYLNHYYLAALLSFLLALSPANRSFSLDALLRRRLGHTWWPREHVANGWLWLFRLQVGVVYTFAGLAKAHSDWLVHAQPLSIWLGANSDLPVLGPLLVQPFAPHVFSWAGFLFDTSIPWLLMVRRVRPYAYAAVILFHVLTRSLFPIGMFSAIMVLSALVFFPADWPRALLARCSGRSLRTIAPPPAGVDRPRIPRLALVLGLSYCLLQVAMPLRFLGYGGNVRWHEQGMRFSWRVMVREKNGSITFVVHEHKSGRTYELSPSRYLTRVQEREMAGQPDLILALAHHIRDDFARRGRGPVSVHVQALVSLNGRRLAPLIDPSVDLARVSDGLAKAPWILPAPEGPPPAIRPI